MTERLRGLSGEKPDRVEVLEYSQGSKIEQSVGQRMSWPYVPITT